MQYLRARYYLPAQGIFNRLDPFFGNQDDPQSLHKYAYVHGDPVNGSDPSGLTTLNTIMITTAIGAGLGAITLGGVAGLSGAGSGRSIRAAILGGIYGALAGVSIGILFTLQTDSAKRLEVLAMAFTAGLVNVLIELISYGLEQFDNVDPKDPIALRVAEAFLTGLAVSLVVGTATSFVEFGDGWEEPTARAAIGFLTSSATAIFTSWIRGQQVEWATVVSRALIQAIISAASSSQILGWLSLGRGQSAEGMGALVAGVTPDLVSRVAFGSFMTLLSGTSIRQIKRFVRGDF